jgi:hypothetical protein
MVLNFEDWHNENELKLLDMAEQCGATRELDFDSEQFEFNQYEDYLQKEEGEQHIQGWVNAKVVRLYNSNKNDLKQFTKTLNSEQLNQARDHLKTVLEIKNNTETGLK